MPCLHCKKENSKPMPAILVDDESVCDLRIGGVMLLDRLVVMAHRAGCSPITVISNRGEVPLKRAKAFGIPVRFQPEFPRDISRALIASTSLLVTVDDLRLLVANGGRLADVNGKPLPAGIVEKPAASLEAALAGLMLLSGTQIAQRVTDRESARTAERALWASLKSSADGTVDRIFNRPCGRPLSKLLVGTPVSPNAVSIVSILIGLVAAGFFAAGNYTAAVIGALFFQLSAIVDCVDGDIARVALKESPLGKWLDLAGDQVVHVAVFGGIAWGLLRSGAETHALWLGASAILGALLSFAVIVRGLSGAAGKGDGRLQKLIDSATNRDFSVLVLALAFLGKLEWFLWMTAIGSHLFWMTALALQFAPRATEKRLA